LNKHAGLRDLNGVKVVKSEGGAIAPGFIQTEMTQSIKSELIKQVESSIPLRRMGQPDEIAHAIQFSLGVHLTEKAP